MDDLKSRIDYYEAFIDTESWCKVDGKDDTVYVFPHVPYFDAIAAVKSVIITTNPLAANCIYKSIKKHSNMDFCVLAPAMLYETIAKIQNYLTKLGKEAIIINDNDGVLDRLPHSRAVHYHKNWGAWEVYHAHGSQSLHDMIMHKLDV